jgi:dihydrofolate synthase/folylpolyglutamate synthase
VPVSKVSARAYLDARAQFRIKFGLETITALLRVLGNPQGTYPTLLVAGTNGKGSVVAYADRALRASKLRVGRYISPHLVRVHERIVVDGREISERDLETALSFVRGVAESLLSAGTLPAQPTYFEVITAAAFVHFQRKAVDVAVLEVGMGGRLDATNVSQPLASAITTIDHDHEAYLGTTLDAIAREKAGVLRKDRTTILGPLAPEARSAISERAAAIGARLVDAFDGTEVREDPDGLEVRTPRGLYRGLRPLPGMHQRANVIVALRLLEEAKVGGIPVDLRVLPQAIEKTRWPGRLQWVPGHPPLLLDGAHNPAGARALAAYVAPHRPFVLLFGVMSDKDVAELAGILFPLAEAVVLTRPGVARAATPEEIAKRAGGLARGAHLEARSRKALALARRLAGKKRLVVVAGSLYLVGEVLGALKSTRK